MSGPADPEPIQLGSKAGQSVPCARCQQQIPAGQYYSYTDNTRADVFLCSICREQIEQALEAEGTHANLLTATLCGLAAGLVVGAAWHAIVVVTGYEIGYVAIGAGWLIGMAVHVGAGRKRAVPLQALSAGITLLTLLVANYFTFLHALRKYLMAQKMAGYSGQFFFVSPLEPAFLQHLVSPMGLLIWAIALYVAFSVPKPRSL